MFMKSFEVSATKEMGKETKLVQVLSSMFLLQNRDSMISACTAKANSSSSQSKNLNFFT